MKRYIELPLQILNFKYWRGFLMSQAEIEKDVFTFLLLVGMLRMETGKQGINIK